MIQPHSLQQPLVLVTLEHTRTCVTVHTCYDDRASQAPMLRWHALLADAQSFF